MTESTDMPIPQIDLSEVRLPSLHRMIRIANEDNSAASLFVIGANTDTMTGAVVIVRGNNAAQLLRELLIASQLLRNDDKRADGQYLTDIIFERGTAAINPHTAAAQETVCINRSAHGEAVPPIHCDCPACRFLTAPAAACFNEAPFADPGAVPSLCGCAKCLAILTTEARS